MIFYRIFDLCQVDAKGEGGNEGRRRKQSFYGIKGRLSKN